MRPKNFFFLTKKAILFSLISEGKNITYHKNKLLKEFGIKSSLCFLLKSFKDFESWGLIRKEKESTKKKVFLTEKGKIVKNALNRILKTLQSSNHEVNAEQTA